MKIDVGAAGVGVIDIPLPDENVIVGLPVNRPAGSWEELTRRALAHPLGVQRISEENLAGKKVVVITDDWGRPTPAWRMLPAVLEELHAAGARREDITFVTGSGMHDTMSKEDLIRKLGAEVVENYRCISHDAGDVDNLVFMGVTDRGIPVWINRYVAEADYRIAIGRVHPHPTHGYEGGYKAIMPSIASFESILRNHSSNFSRLSTFAVARHNPSRDETDEIGLMVGLDFVIGIVVNYDAEPVQMYAGHVLTTHRACIHYGERYVWGVEVGEPADFTIAIPGLDKVDGVHSRSLEAAMRVTKPHGTIILHAGPEGKPPELDPERKRWRELPIGEIYRLHEKRNWNMEPRPIQHLLKALRGEHYRRRAFHNRTQDVLVVGGPLLAETIQEMRLQPVDSMESAIQECIRRHGEKARVIVLPKAATTIPFQKFHEFV